MQPQATLPEANSGLGTFPPAGANTRHWKNLLPFGADMREVEPKTSVFDPRTLVHSWKLQCKLVRQRFNGFWAVLSTELVSSQRKRHTADTLRPAKWLLCKVLEYVPAYGPSVRHSG